MAIQLLCLVHQVGRIIGQVGLIITLRIQGTAGAALHNMRRSRFPSSNS